jgi:hypothetical protein
MRYDSKINTKKGPDFAEQNARQWVKNAQQLKKMLDKLFF